MKALKAIYDQYKLPLQIVAGVVVAIIIGYVVYRLYIWAKDAARPTDSGSSASDIAQNTNTSNLTFSPSDYIIIADRLETAMNHLGSNDDAVIEAWQQMRTADDVRATITAFGIRTNYLFSVPKYDAGVIKWMQEELSADSLTTVKNIFAQYNIPF